MNTSNIYKRILQSSRRHYSQGTFFSSSTSSYPIMTKKLPLSHQNFLSQHFSSDGHSKIKFSFIEMKDPSNRIAVEGSDGESVLDVALRHNIDIEGACGGEMACSTCHVILEKDLYEKLPSKTEEEQDMLDLAWGLEPTSRLCCQIKLSKLIENQTFRVPEDKNNMF